MADLRGASDAEALRAIINRESLGLRTILPGQIVEYDRETNLATVQPAIQSRITQGDTTTNQSLPQIVNVPILLPHSQTDNFSITLPVKPGDDVLLLFADRSVDTWIQNGGIQPIPQPNDPRHHDLTDCFALLSATPQTRRIADPPPTNLGIEIRNADRTSRVHVRQDRIVINQGNSRIRVFTDRIEIDATSTVTVTTPTTTFNGDIVVTGEATIGGIAFTPHTHTHGDPAGTTGPPQ